MSLKLSPHDRPPAAFLKPLLAALLLVSCAPETPATHVSPRAEPEAATGVMEGTGAAPAQRHMVAAANPLAAKAGRDILRGGGSAVDAAIAVQMVLNLVEPQSSGIGGGGFLLHYDAASGEVGAFDGRETAPRSATPGMFLNAFGSPKEFFDAALGGKSVGVPGLLRMLELAHARHGRLPWAELFAPAIALAEEGFPVSERLHALIARDRHLSSFAPAAAYFYGADGAPRRSGEILANRPLAETLRAVAEGGADAFYSGEIARDIAAAVRSARVNPGGMTPADLAAYEAEEKEPLCRPYRRWRVCGAPPPTSGGITLLQVLRMLEWFDLNALEPDALRTVHLISEALRLAYADRARFIADPAFVAVPVMGLLDLAYLDSRASLISPARSMGEAAPGAPPGGMATDSAPVASPESPSTTHISVVDGDGNAVALTSSIESAFGSRLMVRGFLLNNQLTDFSFRPESGGIPVANRVEPGKKPLSSMAPTLVFDGEEGGLVLVLGSPGGANIIPYVLTTLVAVLDQGVGIPEAVALPHYGNRNGFTEIEEGTALEALDYALTRMGHEVVIHPMTSGLHGIQVTEEGLLGGADPRREGVALGD